MRRLGIERAPATLWVYVLLATVPTLVVSVIAGPRVVLFYLSVVVFTIGISLLLLRGSRVLWCLGVGLVVFDLCSIPFLARQWWDPIVSLVSLALLLAPASRRYVWRPRPKPGSIPVGANLDPNALSDPERPAGWYVDPVNPWRMRYWNPELGEWQGKARTPRKVRKAWEESRRLDS